jgi:hypothetical protein
LCACRGRTGESDHRDHGAEHETSQRQSPAPAAPCHRHRMPHFRGELERHMPCSSVGPGRYAESLARWGGIGQDCGRNASARNTVRGELWPTPSPTRCPSPSGS